jgi:hypothetical protein
MDPTRSFHLGSLPLALLSQRSAGNDSFFDFVGIEIRSKQTGA